MIISLDKILLIIFTTLIWQCSNSQPSASSTATETKPLSTDTLQTAQDGIVYFSYDNGRNWINSSSGLPGNVRIGLGGIATSNQFIGLATKDDGAYLYDFKNKMWDHVSTDQEIIAANIGAMAIKDSIIFVGTQYKGVFYKHVAGENWKTSMKGLATLPLGVFANLMIRFMFARMTAFIC